MATKKKIKRAVRRRSVPESLATVRIKPGPKKRVSQGAPPRKFTTHKVRAAWFQARASYPVREANVERLVSERERVSPAVVPGVNWTLVGPTNIGGRCTAVAVHPTNPDTLYIG